MSIFDNMNETATAPVSGGTDFINNKFYTPILKKDGTELELWKPVMGDNYFDLIPFIMGTDTFAMMDLKRAKGSCVYDIMVDVNMRLKQGNTSWEYPSRSSLKLAVDPIHEEKIRLFAVAKDRYGITGKSTDAEKLACKEFQTAKGLFPSTRSLYIVAVYDRETIAFNRLPANIDNQKKVKRTFHLFAPAIHSFGKKLEAKKSDEGKIGNTINWGHPILGPTIYIQGKDATFKAQGEEKHFVGYDSIAIMPRIEAYPKAGATEAQAEEFITKMPKLDEHITVPTSDEVYKALFGASAPVVEVQVETPKEDETGLEFKKTMDAPVTVVETVVKPPVTVVEPEPVTDPYEDDIPF